MKLQKNKDIVEESELLEYTRYLAKRWRIKHMDSEFLLCMFSFGWKKRYVKDSVKLQVEK